MKQILKNEIDMLDLINKIQAQLTALNQKIDSLINRSLPEAEIRSNDRNKARLMHTAICADCKKECKIPFKPSGDRPVYCQDCFSRRKVISLSGIKFDDKSKEVPSVQTAVNKTIDTQKPQIKSKKKAVTIKKSIGKKKMASKKK